MIKAPHLLHLAKLGVESFQFAFLLSRLALDTLPLGPIAPIVTPPARPGYYEP